MRQKLRAYNQEGTESREKQEEEVVLNKGEFHLQLRLSKCHDI